MRRAALLAAALAVGCSPELRRSFPVGLLGPVSSRIAAEAGRLGLAVSDAPPAGAAVETTVIQGEKGGAAEVTANWETLRFLAARAAVRGAGGVFFRLSRTPEGRDLLDYPEEWQAVIRAVRELTAMKPVLERGTLVVQPFEVPDGLEVRAWTYRGRRYVLLVNSTSADAPLNAEDFVPWRALFEVRSDARYVLKPCGTKHCLSPGKALWLEGRLLSR